LIMQTTDAFDDYSTVTRVFVPRSRSNGLWSALIAQMGTPSAAGSRLAGPDRSGQPVSLRVPVAVR